MDCFHRDSKAIDGFKSQCIDCRRAYNDAHVDEINITRRARLYLDRERIRSVAKKYRLSHTETIKSRMSVWRSLNRARTNKTSNDYQRRRAATDPAFRMLIGQRSRVSNLLKSAKASATVDLLGCTAQELRVYLEARFKPGMNWSNYGRRGWHIDHRRAICSFDLSDPAQQRACFHYTNLQPLWWHENLAKRSYDFARLPEAAR